MRLRVGDRVVVNTGGNDSFGRIEQTKYGPVGTVLVRFENGTAQWMPTKYIAPKTAAGQACHGSMQEEEEEPSARRPRTTKEREAILMGVPAYIFRGTNLMTPQVLEVGTLHPGLYYELSTDNGEWAYHVEHDFSRTRPLVGVTVRDANGQDVGQLSKSFRSETQARNYIAGLRRWAQAKVQAHGDQE